MSDDSRSDERSSSMTHYHSPTVIYKFINKDDNNVNPLYHGLLQFVLIYRHDGTAIAYSDGWISNNKLTLQELTEMVQSLYSDYNVTTIRTMRPHLKKMPRWRECSDPELPHYYEITLPDDWPGIK